eukprot:jgi/Chrzof1/5872/Cz16g18250.t1
MSASPVQQRCYKQGRFLVTEADDGTIAHRCTTGASKAGEGISKSKQILDSISEKQSQARVYKRGRFKVFTCCTGDASSTLSDDEDSQPLTCSHSSSKLPSSELNILVTPADAPVSLHSPPPCSPSDHYFDTASSCSWDSASSNTQPCCTDAHSPVKPSKACRKVRFNDVGPALTPTASPTRQPAPATQHNASPTPCLSPIASNAYFPSAGSLADAPKSVTKSYQRGRFIVQEAVLMPAIKMARSSSLPVCSSSPAESAKTNTIAKWENGVRCGMESAAGLAGVWPAVDDVCDVDDDQVVLNQGPSGRRHHTVSYFRRGRFLVQTIH